VAGWGWIQSRHRCRSTRWCRDYERILSTLRKKRSNSLREKKKL